MLENGTFQKIAASIKILFALVLILFQLTIITLVIFNLNYYANYFYFVLHLMGFFVILVILSANRNYSYKLSWAVFFFLLPTTALVFYFFFGRMRYVKNKQLKESKVKSELHITSHRNNDLVASLSDKQAKNQLDLLYKTGYFNSFNNSKATYFKLGEEFFNDMIEKLKDAQEFILLEYYIISDGILYEQIHSILLDRIANGVEIYLMYDAQGSLTTAPHSKLNILRQAGVKVFAFNNSLINFYTYLNYRSHRKITVIDGKYAYTGGNNIADEYINAKERFGHWKDMGVLIEGQGVDFFTSTFFTAIATDKNMLIQPETYYRNYSIESDSIVTPFADGSTNRLNPAKNNYMKIISTAQDYVYITTPYLIIDDELSAVLRVAAQSGIDVRIILPGVPDKKFIYSVSLAHITSLLISGVRIFTYTPGFVHGKTIVADNKLSTVGSINFDSRSLEWNYECAIHVYDTKFAQSVHDDLIDMMNNSHEITYEEWSSKNSFARVFNGILKVIGPLL